MRALGLRNIPWMIWHVERIFMSCADRGVAFDCWLYPCGSFDHVHLSWPCPRRLRVCPVQWGNDMPRSIFVGYLSEVMKTWSWWKSQKQNDAAQTCCANSGKQPSATFFGYSVWGLDLAIGCFDSFHVDCPRSGWLGEWNQRFGGGVHSKDSAGFLFHCRFFNFNGGVIPEGIQTIYCDLLEFHGFVQ